MASTRIDSGTYFLRRSRAYFLLLVLAIVFQRLFPSELSLVWILWLLVGAFLDRLRSKARSYRIEQGSGQALRGIRKWPLLALGGSLLAGLAIWLIPPTNLGVGGITFHVNPEQLPGEMIMIPAVIFGYHHRCLGLIVVHKLAELKRGFTAPDWPGRLKVVLIVLVFCLVGVSFVVGSDSFLAWTVFLCHLVNLLLSYLSMRLDGAMGV